MLPFIYIVSFLQLRFCIVFCITITAEGKCRAVRKLENQQVHGTFEHHSSNIHNTEFAFMCLHSRVHLNSSGTYPSYNETKENYQSKPTRRKHGYSHCLFYHLYIIKVDVIFLFFFKVNVL